MKKKLITTSIFALLVSSNIQARDYEMPANCEYEGKVSYDYSINQLQNQLQLGYDIYSDPDATSSDRDKYSSWIQLVVNLLSAFDSVKVDAPKHVLQEQTFQVKGEAFLDPYVNINFSNSEYGFIGTDKTNLEMNAYKSMSFKHTYGPALVWAHRASGLCSSQQVWVQKAPDILSASSNFTNGNISGTVKYSADMYSEAALNSSIKVNVQLKAVSDIYGSFSSTSVSQTSLVENVNLNVAPSAGGGPYTVKATVSDGNFSKTMVIGSIIVPGPSMPPCPTCEPL